MKKDKVNILRNFLLFSEMNEDELADISKLIKKKVYSKNQIIFMQGEEAEKVFFLNKGKVKIIKTTPDGSEQILEILEPGEVFGEVVLFDIGSYPATTRTMDEVEVFVLSRSEFRKYFNKNPEIGWGMLKVMARKLRNSQKRIENLGLRTTKGRIASLLIDMMEDYEEENKVILNFNQSDLANYLGTSRETVSRTLSQFRKQGLIKTKGKKLSIIDLEGLKQYL